MIKVHFVRIMKKARDILETSEVLTWCELSKTFIKESLLKVRAIY